MDFTGRPMVEVGYRHAREEVAKGSGGAGRPRGRFPARPLGRFPLRSGANRASRPAPLLPLLGGPLPYGEGRRRGHLLACVDGTQQPVGGEALGIDLPGTGEWWRAWRAGRARAEPSEGCRIRWASRAPATLTPETSPDDVENRTPRILTRREIWPPRSAAALPSSRMRRRPHAAPAGDRTPAGGLCSRTASATTYWIFPTRRPPRPRRRRASRLGTG